jgi:broad-specificity NMP kinase
VGETVTVDTPGGRIGVIEVLGLPGSGKTTVVDTIAASTSIDVLSRYRRLANVPAYAMAAMRLAPSLASGPWTSASWRDRNRMIRAQSSLAIARRHARSGRTEALVFDQGPLFLLRQLGANDWSRSDAIAVRRAAALRQWSRTLDLVVLLDAPDDVLLARIRSRDKHHLFEDLPEGQARQALDADRRSFDLLLEEVRRHGCVRVDHLDTSSSSAAATAASVVRAIAAVTIS